MNIKSKLKSMVSNPRWDRGLYWQRAWSLVEGCTHIDKECRNCWSAEQANIRQHNPAVAHRHHGLVENGKFNGQIRLMWDDLQKPTPDQKPAVWSVWNDLFHPGVPFEFQYKAVERMHYCPQHFFIVCTKRPEIASDVLPKIWFHLKRNHSGTRIPLPNLLGMTTAGYQGSADRRVPQLRACRLAWRGLSVEPMLGYVRLPKETLSKMDIVICGGESVNNATPMHPVWPTELKAECDRHGVPFLFKQWGQWGIADVKPTGTPGKFSIVRVNGKLQVTDQYPSEV